MEDLRSLLERTAALHRRLCPRQVLGVRIGLLGARRLGLEVPRGDKRLFVFVETDGCALDGISVSTGCTVGGRTMRVLDFGKVAATFVDREAGTAFRVWPHPESRRRAVASRPEAESRWQAQLRAYQTMPDDELLLAEPVELCVDLGALIGRAGPPAVCDACGEEVINQREVRRPPQVLCRPCAASAYYRRRAP